MVFLVSRAGHSRRSLDGGAVSYLFRALAINDHPGKLKTTNTGGIRDAEQ